MKDTRPKLSHGGTKYTCIVEEDLPHEIAVLFARMDASQQAEFFDYVATIVGRWEKPQCFQWREMVDGMSGNAKQCLASMAEELR